MFNITLRAGLAAALVTLIGGRISGRPVAGVVSDQSTGSPISGVSVLVLETADSTVTDISGKYVFSDIPDGAYTLLIGGGDYQPLQLPGVVVGNCCLARGNVDDLVGPAGPVDVVDLTYLVAFLFSGGPAPPCTEAANIDAVLGPAGPIDVADLTYLVAFLFQGSSAPPPC